MISRTRRNLVRALAAAPLLPSLVADDDQRQGLQTLSSQLLASEGWIPVSFNIGERKARLRRVSSRERHGTRQFITEIELREEIEPLSVILTVEENTADSYCRVSIKLRAEQQIAKLIGGLSILDLSLSDAGQAVNHLYGITGGFTEDRGTHTPTAALKPWTRTVPVGHVVEIDSDRSGRSSNSQVPLWVYAGPRGGYWFGPEWSGCWRMRINRESERTSVQVCLPTFNFAMQAGEQLQLPAAAFGYYRGDLEQGLNSLRATILWRFLPKHDGRAPAPKVVFQGYAGLPKYQTEEVLYQEVDRAAEVGCEAFVLDAGWNQPPNTTKWLEWLGHWQPDPQRFPLGFERFAKHVHDQGMKLGLWIEPRAATSSPAYKNNADLYLLPSSAAISSAAKFWTEQANFEGLSPETILNGLKSLNENKGLLNLGRKEARTLLLSQLEGLLSLGADWIWFDLNTDPRLTIWDFHEKPDRKGLLELEFYQGLYEVFDTLLERHPQVWIESCSAGGRMIDLGMLRRSHSIWVCDTASDEVGRSCRRGANSLLPAATIQTGLFLNEAILFAPPPKPVALGGSHRLLTSFGGVFQFGQGLCFWSEADIKEAKRYVQAYKEHRAHLSKDFYNLLPSAASVTSWDAWQYHDPVADAGILLLFRMSEDAEREKNIAPKGLKSLTKYKWSTVLGGTTISSTDRELRVAMDSPGAALVQYSRR
jgi:hypothetical protein